MEAYMSHINRWLSKLHYHVFGILIFTISSSAFSAGFQISEQSGTGLGRAFAGWGVINDDLSNAFYNPAGITQLEGTQIQATGFLINGNSRFTDDGTSGVTSPLGPLLPLPGPGANGDGGTLGAVPNLYFITDITDKLKYGFSISAPFGLKTDYDGDFVGRYTANESELVTININPSLGYELSDSISLGVGFSAQYADATLSQSVLVPTMPDGFAEVTGDDWGYGWNAGIMYHPNDNFRAAVGFRSKISHEIRGDNDIEGTPLSAPGTEFSASATARVDLPETIHAGMYYRFAPKWGASLGLRWTRWNRLDELVIVTDSPLVADSVLELEWENSISANIGIDYYHSDKWTFRAGYMFDETPTQDEFRTPRIPDEDRHWVALGGSYNFSQNLQIDFGYAHLFFEDAEINITETLAGPPAVPVPVTGAVSGEFEDTDVDILSIQAVYKF